MYKLYLMCTKIVQKCTIYALKTLASKPIRDGACGSLIGQFIGLLAKVLIALLCIFMHKLVQFVTKNRPRPCRRQKMDEKRPYSR